jgi:pyrroloquinoline quinone biosynthesis protein B
VRVRILGSSAGGGVPQWNCACAQCAAVRAGDPRVRARTQSSVAVSADGEVWYLIDLSPDLRRQLARFRDLDPPAGAVRGSRIGGVLFSDGEVDHVAGLLTLREGGPFPLFATETVRGWLHDELPLARALERYQPRTFELLPLDGRLVLAGEARRGSAEGRLSVRAFELSRRPPRYVADRAPAPGAAVGLIVEDLETGGRLVHAACVPARTRELELAVEGADLVLFDGTFWSEDELARIRGPGLLASDLGHWPVGGERGSLAWLGTLPVAERVYVHVNNTNPMLVEGGPEHAAVASAGVRVGADGDEFTL